MPVGLTSDKFLRAERRNRLENFRFDVKCKHLDKETTRMHYDIDREKRSIVKSFRTVVRTSGISEEGVPPKDENDNDYEKSQSYRQGFRISNKRLIEWRECEKQLDKFIRHSEIEMFKYHQRRPIRKSQREGGANIRARFSDDDDDDDEEVFVDDDASSIASTVKSNPIDVIKDDTQTDGEFDVKKWQKSIIEDYTTMICKPKSRPTSAYSERLGSRLKSHSSPALTTNVADLDQNSKKKPRPHTAHVQRQRRPASGKSLPRRPASATVGSQGQDGRKFLITKDSVYIKNGNKFEKFAESVRPLEKPVLVNNYLSALPPSGRNGKTINGSSVNGLCPVKEDSEDDSENSNKMEKGDSNDNKTADDLDGGDEKNDTVPEIPKDFQRSFVSSAFQKWKTNSRSRPKSGQSGHSSASRSSQSSKRSSTSGLATKPSMADISAILAASRRTRRDSESSTRKSSISTPSVTLGIPADIEDISKDQEKLVTQVTPERPLQTSKLVTIGTVVKAAMSFSKAVRQRALKRMQDENSEDSHEIIRQERIRKLHSRANVLTSMTSQWQAGGPLIEAVD